MSAKPTAYQRAIRYLARRAHSTVELRRKLLRTHDEEETERALRKASRRGYLDDSEFACRRATLCRVDKAWGDRRIELDLASHEIPPGQIRKALEAAGEELSESDALQALVDNWLRIRGRPETARDCKKLHDRCLRLGHRPPAVRRALAPFFPDLDWE